MESKGAWSPSDFWLLGASTGIIGYLCISIGF